MYIYVTNYFTGFLSVLGTIYAVLSILKISFEDLRFALTFEGVGSRDEEMLLQKEQARIGISLVILSFVFESINSLICINTAKEFGICLITEVVLTFVVLLIVVNKNKKFRKNYSLKKQEFIKN